MCLKGWQRIWNAKATSHHRLRSHPRQNKHGSFDTSVWNVTSTQLTFAHDFSNRAYTCDHSYRSLTPTCTGALYHGNKHTKDVDSRWRTATVRLLSTKCPVQSCMFELLKSGNSLFEFFWVDRHVLKCVTIHICVHFQKQISGNFACHAVRWCISNISRYCSISMSAYAVWLGSLKSVTGEFLWYFPRSLNLR